MEQEWEAMPKDVNRNQFTKRITQIIGSLKTWNGEIKQIIGEVTEIKKETQETTQKIQRID